MNDILELTRDVDAPTDRTLDAARGRLLAHVATSGPVRGRSRAGWRSPVRWPLGLAMCGVAAAVVVAVVARPAVRSTAPEFTTAAQVLAAAAKASPPDVGDAPYWRVVYETSVAEPDPDGVPTGTTTEWIGLDGRGVMRNTALFGRQVVPLTGGATVTVAGRSYTWREVNAGAWSDREFRALVAESIDRGDAAAGPGSRKLRRARSFDYVAAAATLLAEAPASTAVRQRIWQEVATFTGERQARKMVDRLGRVGWEVRFAGPDGPSAVLVDPRAGVVLEIRSARAVTTYREAGPARSAPRPTVDADGYPVRGQR